MGHGVEMTLPDESATEGLGRRLAAVACPGDVILLVGPLAAGKTVLARGFVRALAGDEEDVPSPTFTLVQTYPTPRGEVWHFDLFRIERPEEVVELGIDDAFASGISLIEWPERLDGRLPRDRLEVRIAPDDATGARRATLAGGPSWAARLAALGAGR